MLDPQFSGNPTEENDHANERPDRDPLEKIGRSTFQAVLNILTESPFFYADDDPLRFNSLRRNESAFRRFFEKYFGWRLYVDVRMARIIKDQNFNPVLKPAHRSYFKLTTRNECIFFLMLLEFYEHECTEQAYSYDDLEPLKFTYADFLSFAKRSCNDHLGDKSPPEREIDAIARQLLRKLHQYRLLRVVEVEEKSAGSDNQNMLIEVLPGLNCYEGRKMAEAVVALETDDESEEDHGENL